MILIMILAIRTLTKTDRQFTEAAIWSHVNMPLCLYTTYHFLDTIYHIPDNPWNMNPKTCELQSILLVNQKDMDPEDLRGAGNIIPIWNPMSILHMALLSIILTVAHMEPQTTSELCSKLLISSLIAVY